MEILRFDEPDAPTPKRKRPSKAWLALSMVAALMGVGTAFASSTININKNNLTPLGQGVATATTCDNTISVTPDAALALPTPTPSASEDKLTQEETVSNAPTFKLGSITIGNVDASPINEVTGVGCGGADFKVQVYKNRSTNRGATFKAVQLSCSDLGATGDKWGIYDIGGSGAAMALQICDGDGSIIFRVASTNQDLTNAKFQILLNGSTDFDYITLVSTKYLPFDS